MSDLLKLTSLNMPTLALLEQVIVNHVCINAINDCVECHNYRRLEVNKVHILEIEHRHIVCIVSYVIARALSIGVVR